MKMKNMERIDAKTAMARMKFCQNVHHTPGRHPYKRGTVGMQGIRTNVG